MSFPPIEFDPLDEDVPTKTARSASSGNGSHPTRILFAVATAVVVAVVGWAVAFNATSSSRLDPTSDGSANVPVGPGYDGVVEIAGSIPAPLLAAELFAARVDSSNSVRDARWV